MSHSKSWKLWLRVVVSLVFILLFIVVTFRNDFLLFSIEQNSVTFTNVFLSIGANPNSIDYLGIPALSIAAMNIEGGNEIAKFLLTKGANPNLVDTHGNSPLHVAIHAGSIATIKTLLKNGANPNLATKDGRTPIFFSVFGARHDVLELLITYGGKNFGTNKKGTTALEVAKQNLDDFAVRRLESLSSATKQIGDLAP